ncbi:ABC-2 type transport system ATP-binding protein [Haloactinospora alba]|uniref:ABC-2 type transport system ATP-binding protein n=1 Tax=Haloactinospora alba TaxID=405555 RepID=A0A543NMV6_9ACTN|nr:ABC transporter ATP-binding protein [Haloactinospora alba]TQN33127.1 ABC-2 type transport system ATP-binding protein [Haloactinospora alba]
MTATNPPAPSVEARGLAKSYGGDAAVDGVDLSAAPGEILALLGPNGAGKSTTVEILAGFRDRDRGTARVLGADPARAGRAWRARTGIVWQHETEGSPLRAYDIVRHVAGYYPRRRAPEEVLELVGLSDQARTAVRELSGGQRRRLDVALGVVGRPEVLFLDEPTTGFDPAARRSFWDLVRSLALDGTTILLTTHYLEEAEALADRVVVLARGRIVAEGDPATLGGRADARATVSWLSEGRRRSVRTAEPTALLRELLTEYPGEVPELAVHRPSLEETYLGLVDGGDDETAPRREGGAANSGGTTGQEVRG